jgi:hypothetical protein
MQAAGKSLATQLTFTVRSYHRCEISLTSDMCAQFQLCYTHALLLIPCKCYIHSVALWLSVVGLMHVSVICVFVTTIFPCSLVLRVFEIDVAAHHKDIAMLIGALLAYFFCCWP